MRVNIVVTAPDLPWIAGRLARELVARLPRYGVEATINGGVADIEYQQIVYGPPSTRPAVGMFTHGQDRPLRFGASYDGQIALNPAMLGYLRDVVGERATMIALPVDDQFRKHDITFGVAGRTYADGRKGEHLVAAMVKAGYRVIGWGHGWPCQLMSSHLDDLPLFYRAIDYYVDTSSDEGGCVPALEAMACGVPVISHTLGVDRPVLAYETHSWSSLERVLRALTVPVTYDDWAREHAKYFHCVLDDVRLEREALV